MIASRRVDDPGASALGGLLRHWRALRGRSQLDLALEAGLSQRHVSFVESGRSRPGRQTLMDMAEALDVPLRERNALLLAAGYAPAYADAGWDAPEMAAIRRALQRMLRQHEPYPAIVMDSGWNVVMANASAPRFFGLFVDMAARRGPRNMLHLMFDPEGMRPFVHDWERVARSLLWRVRREAVGRVRDARTERLLAELKAYPDVPAEARPAVADDIAPISPVAPLSFVREGVVLNYFSMVSVVGAPEAVAAQELRLESLFPADASTERRHAELMAGAAS